MKTAAAFLGGAAIAAAFIYIAWTVIEHERTFDNQEEFVN